MDTSNPLPATNSPETANAPAKRSQQIIGGIVLVVLIAICGGLVVKCAGCGKALLADLDLTEAQNMARRFVLKELKSPSTASFGKTFEQRPEDNVVRLGDGQYLVRGWVDAQNSFGGVMRRNWMCQLRRDETDSATWHLVTIKIDE